ETEVVFLQPTTHVGEQHHAAESRALEQVAIDELAPVGALALRTFGVAVAGQIDQGHASLVVALGLEPTDLARATRSGAGANQGAPFEQAIEQAALADVGPARKGDLDQRRRRELIRRRGPSGELGV